MADKNETAAKPKAAEKTKPPKKDKCETAANPAPIKTERGNRCSFNGLDPWVPAFIFRYLLFFLSRCDCQSTQRQRAPIRPQAGRWPNWRGAIAPESGWGVPRAFGGWRASDIEESDGRGGRCARPRHATGPTGRFSPVLVDAPGNVANPTIQQKEPDVPDETKTEGARRLKRNS